MYKATTTTTTTNNNNNNNCGPQPRGSLSPF
jgi:hypothetical protein